MEELLTLAEYIDDHKFRWMVLYYKTRNQFRVTLHPFVPRKCEPIYREWGPDILELTRQAAAVVRTLEAQKNEQHTEDAK